jgi:hypothetical protein
LCAVAVLAGLAATGTVQADGLPVLGIDVGAEGVALPGARYRYVTAPVGDDTLVARVERTGGRARRFRILRGALTIPAVAYDGSAAGLTADGTSLVLIAPRDRFPRARTSFAIVGTSELRIRRRIVLHGDFGFDAVSPDGRWLYLVHYTAPRDPLRYEVRVLDASTGRLEPQPIVDPREQRKAMSGRPLTRVATRDGRWAYTLYDARIPFVHALDTVGRTARCVDLPWLRGRKDLWAMRLRLGRNDGRLRVGTRAQPAAVIDTQTLTATPAEAGA